MVTIFMSKKAIFSVQYRALLLAAALMLAPLLGLADSPSPADAGVRLEKPVGDGLHFLQGSGIFLGEGLVLTAAHVVKADPSNPNVTVILDGIALKGVVVKTGQLENLDLALVKLDPQTLTVRRRTQTLIAICKTNPGPNQAVVVASVGAITHAKTISTPITSDGQSGSWTNLLSTGYHPGNSGGGVFNPQIGCLWGIINVELTGTVNGQFVDLTAFVPATKVLAFLTAYQQQVGPTVH